MAARVALPGASIVAAGSIDEARAAAERMSLRMILLDFQLPDAHGFSGLLTLQMQAPKTPIVVVTASEEPRLIEAARAIGAAGFLFKSLPLDDIADRLRRIDAGQTVFPPASTDVRCRRPARALGEPVHCAACGLAGTGRWARKQGDRGRPWRNRGYH